MVALYDLLSADAYRLALMACDRPDVAARAVEEAFKHLGPLLRTEAGQRTTGGACLEGADLRALMHRTVLGLLVRPPGRHASHATETGREGAADPRAWVGRPGLSALQSCCIALGCLRLYTTGQIAEMLDTQDHVVKHAMTDGLRALAQR
ncbi:hypothetical protein E1293_14565 [Actinomadura darangshiensis]|uniref:Uncharacterized protein n=2 Tax=Actinomadura darangshiensis TaxID=705336 RepID=A0A4R5BDY1_9ACTN|nr:hypothetical protein E1293_14565 [Actinomadura darangshiensis]